MSMIEFAIGMIACGAVGVAAVAALIACKSRGKADEEK